MDVIALVRAGFEGAVAPLGTAVTEDQLRLLWRLTDTPTLCFDGDDAGRRAAWRAIERLLPMLQPDKTARIAFLPDGEDPDSLIAAQGRQAMKDVLGATVTVADLVWRQELTAHALETPEGRAGLRAGLNRQADRIGDQTVRDYYRKDFAARLEEAFPWRPGGRRRSSTSAPAGPSGVRPRRPRPAGLTRAHAMLATILNHPALFAEVDEDLGTVEIADRQLDALRGDIILSLSSDPALDSNALSAHLTAHGHRSALAQLTSNRMMQAVPFARRSASLDEARRGWRGVVDYQDQRRILDELRRAKGDLAREATPRNAERVKQLEAQATSFFGDLDPTAS